MSKARELSQRAGVDGALSNRNLLINNDFRIWQRGTIFYGGASNWSYTADRWQAGYTATTEKITGGLKMTIGSNTTGNQLFQIVENIDDAFQRNFDTYTATIKFKAPVGVTVALYVKNWGNGWADLFSGSVAATGNEQTLTVSGPSSGLVSGGNPYFNLIFNGATTGQVIEVYDTQLEGGDTATPFEHRSYGQELALCQRYYRRQTFEDVTWQNMFIARGAGNDRGIVFLHHENEFRAAPTFGHSGAGSFRINNDANDAPVGSVLAFTRRHQSVLTFISTTTGYGSNTAVYINRQQDTSPCYIEWDAEL